MDIQTQSKGESDSISEGQSHSRPRFALGAIGCHVRAESGMTRRGLLIFWQASQNRSMGAGLGIIGADQDTRATVEGLPPEDPVDLGRSEGGALHGLMPLPV